MALKIRKGLQPKKQTNCVVTIYGDAGGGKTTLSLAMDPKSLFFDFNDGLKRAGRTLGEQGGIVDYETTWADIHEYLFSDKALADIRAEYKTLIFDTTDDLITKFIGPWVKQTYPSAREGKKAKFEYYGRLKEIFDELFTRIRKYDFNVILLCHASKDESTGRNETARRTPKVTGGSYDSVMSHTDMLGYFYNLNGVKTLDFNGTQYYDGKNCAQFPALSVPHHESDEYEEFAQSLISTTLAWMNHRTGEQNKFIQKKQKEAERLEGEKAKWTEKVNAAQGPDGMNALVSEMAAISQTLPQKIREHIKKEFSRRANELLLTYKKKEGYIQKEQPAQQPPEAPQAEEVATVGTLPQEREEEAVDTSQSPSMDADAMLEFAVEAAARFHKSKGGPEFVEKAGLQALKLYADQNLNDAFPMRSAFFETVTPGDWDFVKDMVVIGMRGLANGVEESKLAEHITTAE